MPARKRFYARNDIGAVQRISDSRIKDTTATAKVLSVSGSSAIVQILGSNKSVSADVNTNLAIQAGNMVSLTKSESVNRWSIYAVAAANTSQSSPTSGIPTQLSFLQPVSLASTGGIGIIVFTWSPAGPKSNSVYEIEVADDSSETNGVTYRVSGSTFFVSTIITKYARVRALGANWERSDWTDWVSGAPVEAGATSGFGPYDAPYIITVANAALPNAVLMAALGTGLVKNTTGTGIPSIAVAGTDYLSPTGTETIINKTIGATNSITAKDSTFTIQDNADATKQVQFQASGVTTGQIRIVTFQDGDGVIAYLSDVSTASAALAAHIAAISVHGVAGSVVGTTDAQTLTNKTLTAPTIGDFTNATHMHQNSAGGGTLDGAAIASGNIAVARIATALTTPGPIGGTTPDTGAFTNLTLTGGGYIKPSADSTSALLVQNAASTTTWGQIDTTNGRFGIGNNPSAPAQLLDLYDGHLRFTQLTAPGAPTAALAGLGAGNVTTGTHSYKVTFVTPAGETQPGTVSSTITTSAGNGQVNLTSIPTGAAGTTSRNIYRSKAGGTTWYLLASIANNITTTYADNIADTSLVTRAPVNNTTGGGLYSGATLVGTLISSGLYLGTGNLYGLASAPLHVDASGVNSVLAARFSSTTSNNGTHGGYIDIYASGGNVSVMKIVATTDAIAPSTIYFDWINDGTNSTAITFDTSGSSGGVQVTKSLFVGYNYGTNSAFSAGAQLAVQGAASGKTAIFQAHATTPGNLTEWQNSSSAVLASVSSAGIVTFTPLDAATATVTNTMTLDHSTSGTPAAAYGTGLAFKGQSSASASRDMGRIRTEWTTATDASRASKMVLSTYAIGVETDALTILSTGAVGISTSLTITPSAASAATLGSELVTNGDFTTDLSSWTATTWTWGTARANFAGAAGAIDTVANLGIYLNTGGTGYTAGDVLTLTNGANDATITVLTVTSGVIATWSLTSAGTACTVNALVSVTGGTGSGAGFAITKLVNSADTLLQTIASSSGNVYQVVYTVTRSAGELLVTLGGVVGHRVNLSGTYTQLISAGGTTSILFTPTVDFVGSVDAVSVMRVVTVTAPSVVLNSNGSSGLELRPGGASASITAVGVNALYANTTGINNAAFGVSALHFNTTGSSNTAVGNNSLAANTTGGNHTAIGLNALRSNTIGQTNTAVGVNALTSNTTASSNTAVGVNALRFNTTGNSNTSIGSSALAANTTGNSNTAVGVNALTANTTGISNTASGLNTLVANTTGGSNVAIGVSALAANTTGGSNSAVGVNALKLNTTGNSHSAVGVNALTANTTGNSNSALGANALAANTTGSNNTAAGLNSLTANTIAVGQSALGANALRSNTTGDNNTAVGFGAGYTGTTANANTTGGNNTYIGANAGPASTTQRDYSIAIGSLAVVDASNAAVIGAAAGATGFVNVGIGITAPLAKLHIVGEASGKGLIVRANVTTPGNLTEWQTSTGSQVARIRINGTTNDLTVWNNAATMGMLLSVTTGTTSGWSMESASGRMYIFGSLNSVTPIEFKDTGLVGINTNGASLGSSLQVNSLASGKGLIVKAHATTPGNLTEWQLSTAVVGASISSIGTGSFNPVDATTNANTTGLTVGHYLTTANAGANNIATRLEFALADSTSAIGAGVVAGAVNVKLIDATHASRKSQMDLTVTDSVTTRTIISIGADGSAGLLAFYAGTPIAQPTTAIVGATFVSNGGTPITDTDTFGGYTLAQIAKAIQSLSLVA